ncbi:hypothetical protein KIH77_00115 [Bifidobacterium sp. 82T24]|uniref:DUF6466 family protein n=1 Tax=Bifidobacterium pluvialisilvae TaxID=2834436 RepID=UPI001C595C41|nr:DUF6466 family protein [Bifidobacterium pluvialisilvae]MBW3087148.1 hypothetical protein [Bifidobacterium pluvialisilvae]
MSRSSHAPRTERTARASWKVRGPILAAAVILALAAIVAGVNWNALATNNEAVDGLNASIAAYAKESPDLNALRTAQRQTDAQFRDAQSLEALQLPSVRSTIAANAAESARLSRQIDADLAKNASSGGSSASGATAEKNGSQGKGTSDSSEAEKINKMLEQNKKVEMKNVPDTSKTTTEGDESTNPKPW